MANALRGEADVRADGRLVTLRLTLGALAELEQALGAGSLLEIAERVEQGRLSAADIRAVLAAGFRGAGLREEAEGVGDMAFEGGAAGAAAAAVRLLTAAFTGAAE